MNHITPRPHLALKALAATLILTLLPTPELLAQTSVAVHAPMMLHINILEGEEALNNIKERTAREPIIQVEDENHKPVAGAVIIFTSLRGSNGAGGTFNTFTQYRTVTNAEGKAVGRGFQPNTTAGQFTIQVTATLGAIAAATAVIHETNTSGAAGESSSQPNQTSTQNSTQNGTQNGTQTSAQSSTQTGAQNGTQTGAQNGTQAGTQAGAQTGTQAGTRTGTQTGTTTTQTASTAGSAGAKTGIFHVFHVIPKWVIVGVVAGTAAAVTVAVTQASAGTTISTGTGTVGAPTATKPTLGH